MGAASHASLAYSQKSPPLAVLAAAQKNGLQLECTELTDGKKDVPPVLSTTAGYVNLHCANLSGMSCQLTALATKLQTVNVYSCTYPSATVVFELIYLPVGRAEWSYLACLQFCNT